MLSIQQKQRRAERKRLARTEHSRQYHKRKTAPHRRSRYRGFTFDHFGQLIRR